MLTTTGYAETPVPRRCGCHVESMINLDLLITQLALALERGMVLGNADAISKHRKGEKPKDEGELRSGPA